MLKSYLQLLIDKPFLSKDEAESAMTIILDKTDPHQTAAFLAILKYRGGQLSLLIHKNSEECLQRLEKRKVICDFRPPNIIRVTPSPLYNTYNEIYQFALRLYDALEGVHKLLMA